MKDKPALFTAYNPTMLQISRELRRKMTKQERHLWYNFLRNYPVKIYKQRSIDRFVVDFYCSAAKLVIELDGGQHYTPDNIEYDLERTTILNGLGLEVLRFSNLDIDKNFAGVCTVIDSEITKRIGIPKIK